MKFIDSIKIQEPGKMIEVYRGSYYETHDRESWLNDKRFVGIQVEKIKDYAHDPVIHLKLREAR